MNLFEWLGFKKMVEDTDPKNVVKFPEPTRPSPKAVPPAPRLPREYYRVGITDDGQTTLTFITDHGSSITLTMNQSACEQMIRMLRATYTDEEATESENVNN